MIPKTVEPLIRNLSYRVARRSCCDPEDLAQEARIVALEAVQEHDDTLGPLGPWVRLRVTRRIGDQKYWRLRSCVKNRVKEHAPDEMLEVPGRADKPHFLTDLLDGLSEDAAAIVKIVLDTPGYVFRDEDIPGRSSRKFLRLYLQRIGWQKDRINASFREIREALYAPASAD